ncbi:MAG: hypothetical protein SGCHY_004643, partial [Lobulomycetales sp.]
RVRALEHDWNRTREAIHVPLPASDIAPVPVSRSGGWYIISDDKDGTVQPPLTIQAQSSAAHTIHSGESGSKNPSSTFMGSGNGNSSSTFMGSGNGNSSSTFMGSGNGNPSSTFMGSGNGNPSSTFMGSGNSNPSSTFMGSVVRRLRSKDLVDLKRLFKDRALLNQPLKDMEDLNQRSKGLVDINLLSKDLADLRLLSKDLVDLNLFKDRVLLNLLSKDIVDLNLVTREEVAPKRIKTRTFRNRKRKQQVDPYLLLPAPQCKHQPLNAQNAALAQKNQRQMEAIDVCFLLDLTGTMKQWVEEVKDKIQAISRALSKNFSNNTVVNIAFVGYSDYDMQDPPKSKTVYRNFGGVEELLHFTERLLRKRFDGEDIPEDDPCHNQEFHTLRGDRYPTGPDPSGRGPKELYELLGNIVNKEIEYHFFHLSDHTSMMEEKFNAHLQRFGSKLHVHHIGDNLDSFLPSVVGAIGDSKARTMMRG